MTMIKAKHDVDVLEKCPTGIRGLDEITNGGLPKGRPTLVCGGAGSGKTLLGMEFLGRSRRVKFRLLHLILSRKLSYFEIDTTIF